MPVIELQKKQRHEKGRRSLAKSLAPGRNAARHSRKVGTVATLEEVCDALKPSGIVTGGPEVGMPGGADGRLERRRKEL